MCNNIHELRHVVSVVLCHRDLRLVGFIFMPGQARLTWDVGQRQSQRLYNTNNNVMRLVNSLSKDIKNILSKKLHISICFSVEE